MNMWFSNIPRKGWSCSTIIDMGRRKEDWPPCDMCGHTHIRYAHVMQHPSYAGTLLVGCVCASHMEVDKEAAALREKEFHKMLAKADKLALIEEINLRWYREHDLSEANMRHPWVAADNGQLWMRLRKRLRDYDETIYQACVWRDDDVWRAIVWDMGASGNYKQATWLDTDQHTSAMEAQDAIMEFLFTLAPTELTELCNVTE